MFAKFSRSGLALMGLPLYAGPVLAGWSGAPPIMIAALAALFILMQLLRGKLTSRRTLPAAVLLAILMLVQICVVGIVFAFGTGMAMLTGPLAVPLWLPLVLTALGAGVGVLRYRNNAGQAEMIRTIDDALATIETAAPLDPATRPEPHVDTALQQALGALWNLPEGARIGDIDPIVRRLEEQTGHHAFDGLLAEICEGFRNVDLAMLRYLCSPRVRAELIQSDDLGFAMSWLLASDDPGVLQELASLIDRLLQQNAPSNCFPKPAEIREKAKQNPVFTRLIPPIEETFERAQNRCA